MSNPDEPNKGGPWALRVATVAGIPVRLHLTFLLFVGWLALSGRGSGMALVLGLFLCVVLHEFGHALAARRYGIATRDIVLYPIGGVATLTGRLRATQELVVALAGPTVNVVLAAALYGLHRAGVGGDLTFALYQANAIMAAFNMIPAFPMDGGRVLRAFLAQRRSDDDATRIAAGVGQAVAAGLFAVGLWQGMGFLMLVAVFVYLGAGAERRAERVRALLAGHRLGEAMQTRFRTLSHGTRLGGLKDALRESRQTEFPVIVEEEPVGIVSRQDIVQGLVAGDEDAYVASRMRRDPKTAEPGALLEDAVEMFTRDDPSAILVVEEGHLVGMVTAQDVGEFLRREDEGNGGRAQGPQ